MTKVMEELFAEASKLPQPRQDEWAAEMLATLRNDEAWDHSFGRTTDEQWKKLADRVRQQVRDGKGVPLNPDDL